MSSRSDHTGGIHCIHGTPVAKSEMRRDPVAPVCESRLPDWVGIQAHFPVAHIGLEIWNNGPDAVTEQIDRAVAQGVRHLTFDAAAIDHLDRIACLALERYPQALLCGSAGLAPEPGPGAWVWLAGGLPPRDPTDAPPAAISCLSAAPPPNGCASRWAKLAGQANVSVATLDAACLMPGSSSACRANAIQRAAARLAAGTWS